MIISRGYRRGWSEFFVILLASIFIRGYYLRYTNFLNLSDREFVFLSVFISLHTLVKQGDIKAASVPKRLPCSLALLKWFCEQVGRRNKEIKNAEIEEGTIGGDCRDGGMNK